MAALPSWPACLHTLHAHRAPARGCRPGATQRTPFRPCLTQIYVDSVWWGNGTAETPDGDQYVARQLREALEPLLLRHRVRCHVAPGQPGRRIAVPLQALPRADTLPATDASAGWSGFADTLPFAGWLLPRWT